MKKTKVKMNKPIYLGFSILDLKEIVMHKFWCEYMKPKCAGNVELCYMDTDSFMMHIKTEDFYKDIADDVEKMDDESEGKKAKETKKCVIKKYLSLIIIKIAF